MKKIKLAQFLVLCFLSMILIFLKNELKPSLVDSTLRVSDKSSENIKNESSLQTREGSKKSGKNMQIKEEEETLYSSARDLARQGNFKQTAELLHDIIIEDSAYIDRMLNDQAFRDFRDHEYFKTLLRINGRDVYKDLELPPVQIQH